MNDRRASLPRLVFVADRFADPTIRARIVDAVAAGVRWVHLRDHEASEQAFSQSARAVVGRVRDVAGGVHVSVNTRLDLAADLGTGLHVGRRGPSIGQARNKLGPDALLGYSAHDLASARQAVAEGADYVFFSPVFATTSKPGHPGVGTDALKGVCEALRPAPVYALGGVTPERVAACLEAGAHGVAVLSGILQASDVAVAVRAYLEAIAEFLREHQSVKSDASSAHDRRQ